MASELNTDSDVRLAIYRGLVASGVMPSAEAVALSLSLSVAETLASFARLDATRAIVLEPGAPSRVRMAIPFSGVPTPFVVTSGGRSFWANCIWDALGIPACLGTDALIECTCGDCGHPLNVQVRSGRVEGAGIIHFGTPARHWWDSIIDT